MKQKKSISRFPSLTIDGKWLIIKDAVNRVGNKNLTTWLQNKGIPSVKYFNENVRKYKAKLFRELFELN